MFRALYQRWFRQRRPRFRTVRRRWPGYRSLPLRLEVLEPRIMLDASIECFLEGVYNDLLHRPLDSQSLAGWTPMLQQGVSRQAVVSQIENSTEYRTDLINQLYTSYLHRPADAVALGTYLSYLQGGGSVEGIEISLLSSPEFFQSQGGGRDAGFLQTLFEDVLGRPVDPLSQTVFGSLLQLGMPTADVALCVVVSPEADAHVVESDYETYLHRPADLIGLVGWTSWMLMGAGQENLLAGIMGTQDYFEVADQECDLEESQPVSAPPPVPTSPPSCGFDPGLTGWTVLQTGGSATGHGSVTVQNSDAVIHEGDSLTTSLQSTFTIPNAPSVLQFSYDNLSFDTTANSQIKDAFEAAFVDAKGNPLVQTIGTGKDSFFNITEGQNPALAAGVTQTNTDEGQTVSLNLAGLAAGTTGTLVLRLVNNDSDTNTSIHITCVELNAAPGEQPAFATPALVPSTPRQQINFASLTDVTPSATVDYGQTSFNNDQTLLHTNLAVTNTGSYAMRAPLLMAITQLSDPTVHVSNPDGTLPDGTPFFDFSSLVSGSLLDPGQTTDSRSVTFLDPNRAPFHYEVKVLSQLNQPPVFTSQPNTEGIPGVPYVYQATASDPDGDPLTFSVVTGPKGLTIDPTSGKVTFSPQASDLGNHTVTLRVDDGQGASAEQTYTLGVIQAPPNRPPVFTSTPVVDANVNTPYVYQVTATDPDGTKPTDPNGETLTFSVLSGPQGLSIDAASGQVTWQPTADEVGTQNVTLQVDDGRGGTATQTYSVLVQQEPGNLPPVIVSTPVTTLALPPQPTPGPAPTSGLTLTAAGTAAGFALSDFIHGFPTIATGNGLGGPGGIFFPSALEGNEVLVNDGADGSLRLFSSDTDGQDAASAKILGQPFGLNNNLAIAEVNGQLYMGEYAAGKVVELNLDGTVGATIANISTPTGMVANPTNGHLLVAGQAPSAIFEVDPVAHTATPLITGLSSPDGLTISPDGSTVYVANVGSQQLLGFDTKSGKQVFTSGAISGLDGTALGFGTLSGFIFANTNFGQVWEVPLNDPASPILIASGGSRGDFISVDPNNGTLLLTQSDEIVRLTPPSGASFNPTPLYQYPVKAIDQDQDSLTYSLTTAPTGMTIDPSSGLISWDGPPTGSSTTGPAPVDGLKLTGAGTAAGFAVSDFIHGFPTIGNSAGPVGPLGIVFPDALGGKQALISDGPGNLRLFSTDSDGQTIASGQVLANYGSTNVLGLAQLNGELYATQQSTGDVVQLNLDGSIAAVIAQIHSATGIVADPTNGHLYVSDAVGTVFDVDPVAKTATPFLTGLAGPDGLALSPDGKTLYVALNRNNQLAGFDTASGQQVFTSGTISGIDGTAVGFGTLSGFIFANTNFGDVWEIPLNNPTSPVLIAAGGSRGDFIAIDPNDGSLLLTQSDEIVRLTPPAGGSFVQNFKVGVRVDDGRGAFDTQNYTLTVTPAPLTGTIEGTKFNDLNGNGSRDPLNGGLNSGNLTLVYSQSTSQSPDSVVKVNVSYDGSSFTIGTKTTIASNLLIDGLLFGPDGNLYVAGAGPTLYQINPTTGATKTLSIAGNGAFHMALDPSGTILYVMEAQPGDIAVVPLDPFSSGTSHTISGDDSSVTAVAFDASGNAYYTSNGDFGEIDLTTFTTHRLFSGLPSAHGLIFDPFTSDIILVNGSSVQQFDPRLQQIVSSGDFSSLGVGQLDQGSVDGQGHLFVTSNDGRMLFVDYAKTGLLGDPKNFATAPILDVRPDDIAPATGLGASLEPGLPGWTMYLDLNHNGKLDAGEPTAVTDSQGHYAFSNLAPGTYTVAEVGQPGWTQSHPGNNGTYTVTVTAGQTVSGIDFGNTQLNAPGNRPPKFVSTPPTQATVGQLYQYTPVVDNPDGQQLTFDLPFHPAGMVVDPDTGTVIWTPTADEVGTQTALLRMQDARGDVVLQDLNITVAPADTGLFITSTPPSPADVGLPYQYQVKAVDALGLTLQYRLQTAPTGMAIDPSSGLLTWTPTAGQVGNNPIIIVVTDSKGITATQTFGLAVVFPTGDTVPQFTSTPPDTIGLGDTYLYQAQASDSDGDNLSFSLDVAPKDMTINSTTGLVTWPPTADQFGANNEVKVRVTDSRGSFATQDYFVNVVSHQTVLPPSIVSKPPSAATVGHTYAYDVQAVDPQNAPLQYSLVQPPAGMVIDQATGKIRWTPTADQIGSQTVNVQVIDSLGAGAGQVFTITVRGVNVPPVITSEPPTQAAVGQAYRYAVKASDADGDPLTYALTAAPTGMTIDAKTGVITWTPTASEVGNNTVTLTVDDGQGGVATQTYTVVASNLPPNQPPAITSTPPLQATVGQAYQYQVQAADPDSDPVTFSLGAGPLGLFIDPNTGLLTWTPAANQTGPSAVEVKASDPAGATGTQDFTLNVQAVNQPPVITSTAPLTTAAGATYRYDVQASDPDGDPLTYTLTTGPTGMTIDTLGRLSYSPTTADIDSHPVTITVSDGRGATVNQSFTLQVTADTQPPAVALQDTPNPDDIGSPVTLVVSASDNVGVVSEQLTVDGTPLALDANGRATFTPSKAGLISIVATATDAAGNVGKATDTLTVIDPTDTSAPTVAITAPTDGQDITAPITVTGTANDPDLLSYTLSVAPMDTGVFTQIGQGTSAVVNGTLGTLDPTMLQSDTYILKLTATNAGGHTASTEVTFSVSQDLKLGNFTQSFTDLTIPVSGIPITIARTYDTMQANRSEDFGFGWRLEFRDTDLRTSLPLTGLENQDIYTPFQDGARVYLTLPGGQREGFTFEPIGEDLFGLQLFTPNFVPDPGVTDQLSVPGFSLINQGGQYFELNSGLPYNPASPDLGGQYTVTTKDGTVYQIDGNSGNLLTVSDRNHNTLTFSDAGVTSSTGVGITFSRDAQNRIAAITDPNGKQIQYQYDTLGDLISVTDRDGNVTQFVYRLDFAHYLDHAVDPLGRIGMRIDYDAQGRLVQEIDAGGKMIQFAYDPAHSIETVKDALGNPTTYEYDQQGNIITEVDALGGTTRRTFDANNFMLSETDPLGNTSTYVYDSAGNILAVTDPLGNTSRSTYNGFAEVLTQSDPLGNTSSDTYDANGNLQSATDATGATTTFTHDSAGNPSSLTDASGSVTHFEYDAFGNLTNSAGPIGNLSTYTFDADGNALTYSTPVTTASGTQTFVSQTTYDAEGRETSYTDAAGGVTRTEYDAAGDVVATIDQLGHRTKYIYDDRGQLVETVFPDGTSTTATYDADGRLITTTDEDGRTTSYVYDALGRQTEIIFPDNTKTQVEYDADGRETAMVDERGNRTEFVYDAVGRQLEVRDALGNKTVNTYDADGREVASTDALGNTTQYVYDALGRLLQTIYPDGKTSSTTFDSLGRVLTQTDRAGATTRLETDALGRVTAVIDPLGDRTTYGYDEANHVTEQTDANGNVTRYEYDSLGRQVATILPLGQRETTAYDLVGNVISTTDFNGNTIHYQYDAQNRVTEELFGDGTSVQYVYTPTGRRQEVIDSRGVTSYQYDARDRLVKQINPDESSIEYSYDATGNANAVITSSGTTTYTYDELNRLQTVTDPNEDTTRYSYDAENNLVRTERPNGTVETRTYDNLNRLTSLEDLGLGGALISYKYTYDAVGDETSVVESSGHNVNYTYDALGRLLNESISDPGLGSRNIAYTYDAVSNRLSRNDSAEGITSYSYDANDRLLTETLGATTTHYAYDNNGNVLSRITSATDQAAYQWDFQNRLVSAEVTDANGTHHVTNQYDADGNRVSETVDGQETRFLIDSNRALPEVLQEYTSTGTVVATYVYGLNLISQQRGGRTSYYLVDALGSTRALTDENGNITDSYTYDAFGRLLNQVGSTLNNYLFAGQYRDPILGLDYLRARYMDSNTGRFVSSDPAPGSRDEPISLGRYLYAADNPVTKLDPTGLQTLAEEEEVTRIISTLAKIGVRIVNVLDKFQSLKASFDAIVSIVQLIQHPQEFLDQIKNYQRILADPVEAVKEFGKIFTKEYAKKAAEILARNIPTIIGYTLSTGKWFFIARRITQGIRGKGLGFAIYMPTPLLKAFNFQGLVGTGLSIPIRQVKYPIFLLFGRGDRLGRLIGAGLLTDKDNYDSNYQFFRMDYHSQVGHDASASDLISWDDPPFHFHIPAEGEEKPPKG